MKILIQIQKLKQLNYAWKNIKDHFPQGKENNMYSHSVKKKNLLYPRRELVNFQFKGQKEGKF